MEKLDTPTPHCSKCLSPDVLIEFQYAVSLEEDTERLKMVPAWLRGREPEATPDRLALVCNRCRYGWYLLPADSTEPLEESAQ